MTEALVSVVIPTYNRAEELPGAIESVLTQSYPQVEVVVADDGSTDDTRDVVARFDDRVRYLETEHGGPAHARNEGMRAARGDFIAFLDSDDVYLPRKIEVQMKLFAKYPELGMVFTEFSAAYPDGHSVERVLDAFLDESLGRHGWTRSDLFRTSGRLSLPGVERDVEYGIGRIFRFSLLDYIVPTWTMLFASRVLDRVGFQNESYQLAEDYEFSVRICKEFDVGFLDFPTVVYRYHEGQVSRFFTKPEGDKNSGDRRKEVETYTVYLKTVLDWALSDVDFYAENKELVDRRLFELYGVLGQKWIRIGEGRKAAECFAQCRRLGPRAFKHFAYELLARSPAALRSVVLEMIAFKNRFGRSRMPSSDRTF